VLDGGAVAFAKQVLTGYGTPKVLASIARASHVGAGTVMCMEERAEKMGEKRF